MGRGWVSAEPSRIPLLPRVSGVSHWQGPPAAAFSLSPGGFGEDRSLWTEHPPPFAQGWLGAQAVEVSTKQDFTTFWVPPRGRMSGLGRGWKVSKMTIKISTLLKNWILRKWRVPEVSLGSTVEAGCIPWDMRPKETIQELLARAGLFPAGWSGHRGSFGTLCRSQRKEALRGQQRVLSFRPLSTPLIKSSGSSLNAVRLPTCLRYLPLQSIINGSPRQSS